MVGKTVSHYDILEKIGQGGMGLVFKARDTKLNRTVALKFLSSATVDDVGKKRFFREAQAAASLNHPNIAYVFDLEQDDAHSFITMEFVEGQTIRELLESTGRPLDIKKAIEYAIQIAAGLYAAHEKAIIHRDIKSANIMIQPNDRIKIMDFGLAKLVDDTIVTQVGARLGTVAYMSPEQAEGDEVDNRTDIWSLGVVLFEMVTGQLPFRGDAEQAVIYSILKEHPPPLTGLRTAVPMELERIVFKALEKNRGERYQHVDELLIDLRVLLNRFDEFVAGSPKGRDFRKKTTSSAIVITCVALLTFGVLSLWLLGRFSPSETHVVRYSIDMPEGAEFLSKSYYRSLDVSPDGQRIAFAAVKDGEHQIYVRNINESASVSLPGAKFSTMPFFSPDGASVGFRNRDTLKTVALGTGVIKIVHIANGPRFGAAHWYQNHSILLESLSLLKLSTEGGTPEQLDFTPQDPLTPEVKQSSPQMLPGQNAVLVTLKSEMEADGDIVIFHLKSGKIDTLLQADYARYVPSGHLIYAQSGHLYAVQFDLKKCKVKGRPLQVLDNIAMHKASAQIAVSDNGTLVYAEGGDIAALETEKKIVFVSHDGKVEDSLLPVGDYNMPRLSLDESKLTYWRDGRHYIYDFNTGTERAVTKEQKAGYTGIFLPDGENMLINAYFHASEFSNVYKIPLDGRYLPQRLTFSDTSFQIPYTITPDGGLALFLEFPNVYVENVRLMALPLSGPDSLQAYPLIPKKAITPALSPDGKWLAYVDVEGAASEVREQRRVCIRPFRSAGRIYKVKELNSSEPVWSPDGKELYYREGEAGTKIKAVSIQTEPEFSIGEPRLLFEGDYDENSWWWSNYCVMRDGRVIIVKGNRQPQVKRIHVVLNWSEELKEKMAAAQRSRLKTSLVQAYE